MSNTTMSNSTMAANSTTAAEAQAARNAALYNYDPSVAAAGVFAALFGIITLVHTLQLVRTKTWFYLAFLIGGYFEWIGYITRAISASENPDYVLIVYIISYILILVAPALLAASIYMELGRIIVLTGGERFSIIRPARLTKVFVLGDVVSFLSQTGGGGLLASKKPNIHLIGQRLITAGLSVQILFFSLFILTAVLFHRRINERPTPKVVAASSSSASATRDQQLPWKRHMTALYLCSALILVRCIYRLIEYVQGNDGYFLTHEWAAYVFDAFLMLVIMNVMALVHPSEVNAMLKGSGTVVSGYKVVGFEEVALPVEEDVPLSYERGYA